MKSPRFSVSLLTLSMLLAVACGKKPTEAGKADSGPPIMVSVNKVSERVYPKRYALTGKLRGQQESDVAAGTNGRLTQVSFDRGLRVKRGQVLAVVDTRQSQLSAQEARTAAALAQEQVSIAERECERSKTLFDKGAISKAEFDRLSDPCRTTALSAQAAKLRAAQAGQVASDGVIRAPFDGLVAERFIDVGEFVRADSRVASIVTDGGLLVEFALPEAMVGALKMDDSVKLQVTAYPGRQFEAQVVRVGVALREATRDLPLEAKVSNNDGLLLPGMFAEVFVASGTEKTPAVDRGALLTREGKDYVYVAEKDRAILRVVSRGPETDGLVSITKGVSIGEDVITPLPDNLSNGALIKR
jgi:RND family efflux transporter MFP subunit